MSQINTTKKLTKEYPVEDVPDLPSNFLDINDAKKIVPIGYSHILSAEIIEEIDVLSLSFYKAEEGNKIVNIPFRLLSPENRRNIFPDFLLEISTHLSFKFNYLKDKEYIINQNQFLYLIIKHRLMQFEGKNVHFTDLLKGDIAALLNYAEYDNYTSYNARKKAEHCISIISPWTSVRGFNNEGNEYIDLKVEHPIGEFISNKNRKIKLDNRMLNSIFRDIPIQPASESMASETGKFAYYPHDKELYRSSGYTTKVKIINGKECPVICSIFKRKPNLPARFKSHIVSDSFSFKESDSPIFIEDIHPEPDFTLKSVLVVFDEMNGDTGRLICGEIEASEELASSVIHKDEVIRQNFKECYIREGEMVIPDKRGNFLLGRDEEGKKISLHGLKAVQILEILETGYGVGLKVTARCSVEIGSSKALSSTGLKGMIKPKPNLGKVIVLDMDSNPVLDNNLPISLDVDMVLGMNSVKGKANSIFLSRACLAHKIGISNNSLLSSMNEKQINYESSKIGKCIWIDEFNQEHKRWVGIVQIKISELSYMYNNVKLQKFMAESGRYLRDSGYEYVFDKIWESGIDPEIKDAVLELQKILIDDKGHYCDSEDIPYFSPDDILYGYGSIKFKVFELEDCQVDMQPMLPYSSKMLDEEYNKGWYLDLRKLNPKLGLVRMPSAKLLNLLTKTLPDGRISYPVIFRMVSRILKICLTVKDNGYRDLPFLVDIKNGDRNFNSGQKHIARYLSMIHGMIYKKEDLFVSKSKMIDVFMKPKILGLGMKQITDCRIPQGVGVIFDDWAYKRLANNTKDFYEEKGHFNALCVRNPMLWKSQIQALKIISRENFEILLLMEYGIKLEDYLIPKYNKECFFMNPFDALIAQSDVD